jgi:hypothetical protein
MTVSIEAVNGMLAFRTPYDPVLVDALKLRVPATDRKWDKGRRVWLVDAAHGHTLQELVRDFYHVQVDLPVLDTGAAIVAMRILEVRYLGRVKQRGGDDESAFAWVNGGWNAVFPKAPLQAWFGREDRPGEAATLYQVLGLKRDAPAPDIKAAWKRLARQWHPDGCREPDAASQFRAIKEAYEILGDAGKRARYDVGLALEASLRRQVGDYVSDTFFSVLAAQEWAPPLRCGYVLVSGIEKLGRFIVAEILDWKDITRDDGAVLVSSWPNGADMFTEAWII